jgi:RNA polymerase sigma-70 factor (ECF subfamily)
MNEDTLIANVIAGDTQSVRILVDRYQTIILRTARGFVRDSEDARDITQEVLIDMITNLHKFNRKSSLTTWIYRITVNRSLNHLRRSKRWFRLGGGSGEEGGSNPSEWLTDPRDKNPAELMEQKDKARILHQALNSLPPNQQTAFTLAEYDDLSYKEIAEVMQVSVSSVESLIFRARKNLQKALWECYKKSC